MSQGENIQYGAFTPLETLLALAIDDNVPERGHRDNIFREVYYSVGVATGPHTVYMKMTVINYVAPYQAPSTTYKAKSITVPKSAAEYKDYAHCHTRKGSSYDLFSAGKANFYVVQMFILTTLFLSGTF